MTDQSGVTVIGLGPMGQAMTRTFLAAGHRTTVWNRTSSRADQVVSEGAIRAATVEEALRANTLVVLSLTDYQAMYDLLADAKDALPGRVVVNLSSDTPNRSEEATAWLAQHGAVLVVGGIMVPAPLVGKDGSYVFYSGDRAAFDTHEPILSLIGTPDYRGEAPGLAQLFYQAQLDIFLTALAAYLHATALLKAAGVPATTFLPYATAMFEHVPQYLEQAANFVDEGEHPGDLAAVSMMGATADHIVGTSADSGVDTTLPKAVKTYYDQAIAAGYANNSWTSLYEVMKRPVRHHDQNQPASAGRGGSA